MRVDGAHGYRLTSTQGQLADRRCFDKRCRPCRPVYVPGTWWTGGRGHGGHIHRAGAVFV